MKALKRIAAGLTVIATVGSTLLSVTPALASAPATMTDTLTREAVSVEATHTLAATTVPTFGNGISLIFDYGTPGFALYASSPSCTIGTGTCTATVSTTSSVEVTCTATNGCSGNLTLGTFAGVNPGSAGSKSVTLVSNDTGPTISGSLSIPIVDSDQVTVTATVAASITFDIDTATTDTETAAPYSVNLGALTTAAVNGSDDSTVNSIWLDLDTNAAGGAVVTVSSTNAALVSTSVPGDTIPSADGTMTAGTANYGICVISVTQTSGSLNKESGTYDGTCDNVPAANVVGGVTVSPQNILNTGSAPVAGGRSEIAVDAAISTSTASHNDYTDILKFIATGTF